MLRTFPEILEPVEIFAHINLTKTAIKELPSSLEYLVGLQTLRLNLCSDLVSLPNSIINLSFLSELDCSGCRRLTDIPNNIGHMSSLRELSLQESNILNLPESIAHLSSLKLLDLSDCKKLECIPQLPPFLKQLLAFDCPSIRRVMPNSSSDDSNEGTFKFHFTNSQELDASARSNIVAESWLRITDDAYRSVFFCFPRSAVPRWFPYRYKGHSVTMKNDSLNWCNDNRLIGFALCVVLGHVDMDHKGGSFNNRSKLYRKRRFLADIDTAEGSVSVAVDERVGRFRYKLTFESDGRTHILPNHDELKNSFYWKGRKRFVVQDHTFLWKYHLDFESIDNRLFHAHNFTFEISEHNDDYLPYFQSTATVKECGICPLYAKEEDDHGGFLRFLNNDNIEEPSGSTTAQ